MTCFVTVGTTLFEALIDEVLGEECVNALRKIGISYLKLQIGNGNFGAEVRERVFNGEVRDEGHGDSFGLPVEFYRFKPTLHNDMSESKVIVGHAGSGTCLEVLALNKPMIAVINELLMDNHQQELAEALAQGSHLLYCTTSTLSSTIVRPELFTLTAFKPPSQKKVAHFIDCLMVGSRT